MDSNVDFTYPKEEYALPFKALYVQLNGPESFRPKQQFQSENWSARIHRSSGAVLEKATFSFLHIIKGKINETPGSINRFETIAYPKNPTIPALFVMTDLTETEDMGRYIVFYYDLIIQDGRSHAGEKELFSRDAQSVCDKHGYNFKEYNEFIEGRGTFGGSAGECGLMGFFQEKDIPFIDDVIKEVVPTYQKMVLNEQADVLEVDYEKMYASRARLLEWMIAESLGTKIMKENEIPLHVIEASSFPPRVKY